MSKSKRISPRDGYDFEAKELYRYRVWSCFAKQIIYSGRRVEDTRVAFMPSKEGLEIPIALSFGFKQRNMFAIDRDKDLLWGSQWDKKYPGLQKIHSEVEHAGRQVLKRGHLKISAVNLDLCGNISIPTVDAIQGFVDSGCMSRESTVAITVMNGRENSLEALMLLKLFARKSTGSTEDIDRIKIISDMCLTNNGNTYKPLVSGKYTSTGGSKMSWGVMTLSSNQLSKQDDDKVERIVQTLRASKPVGRAKISELPVTSISRLIKHKGKEVSVKELLTKYNVKAGTYAYRVKRGWSYHKAATKPPLTANDGASKREFAKNDPLNMEFTYKGKTVIAKNMIEKFGVSTSSFRRRIRQFGWSVEKAATTTTHGWRGNPMKTLTFDGKTLRISEWARLSNISAVSLVKRMKKGWSAEEVLTTPSVIRRNCYVPINK